MNDDARTQDHWGPLRANWEQSLGFTTTAIDVVKSIANANEARENPIGWTVEHLTSVVELAPATADWVSGHFTANETFNSWVHGIIWGKDLAVFAAMAFAPEVTLPAAALGFVELGLSTSSVIEDLSERRARAIRIDATSPSAETHPSAGSTNDGSRTTEQASSQSTSLVCETTEGGAYSSRPEIVAPSSAPAAGQQMPTSVAQLVGGMAPPSGDADRISTSTAPWRLLVPEDKLARLADNGFVRGASEAKQVSALNWYDLTPVEENTMSSKDQRQRDSDLLAPAIEAHLKNVKDQAETPLWKQHHEGEEPGKLKVLDEGAAKELFKPQQETHGSLGEAFKQKADAGVARPDTAPSTRPTPTEVHSRSDAGAVPPPAKHQAEQPAHKAAPHEGSKQHSPEQKHDGAQRPEANVVPAHQPQTAPDSAKSAQATPGVAQDGKISQPAASAIADAKQPAALANPANTLGALNNGPSAGPSQAVLAAMQSLTGGPASTAEAKQAATIASATGAPGASNNGPSAGPSQAVLAAMQELKGGSSGAQAPTANQSATQQMGASGPSASQGGSAASGPSPAVAAAMTQLTTAPASAPVTAQVVPVATM